MNPRISATLEQLEKATWFASVGVKDTKKAIVIASWDDAIELCSSVEWENLGLEAANQFRLRLLEKSQDRYLQWNDIVRQLKPVTESLVGAKIAKVVRDNKLPKVFEHTVQWDILHVCMEAEYADTVPPGYYASQAYWYVKGHFPCGWEGDFPDGTLIVY